MRLSLMLTAFAAPVFAQKATTGFAGIGASNSVGGATKYTCRTQAQWNTVANNAKTHGFGAIRITGFDCDALNRASSAAATYGVKVLAGIWIQGTVAQSMASINSDVQAFRAAYSRWGAGRYAGLTIGNEVNDSPANIMAKVYDVRGYLRSQGVSTPISTVHTWVNIRDNPTLCGADFVAANAHTFYDGNRNSGQAGDFVFGLVVPSLRAKCPGKPVVITESGWPSKGSRFGSKAVASFEDERKAIISLDCAARRDKSVSVYAFEFDDQLWKGNDNERSFGMFWKLNLSGDVLKKC